MPFDAWNPATHLLHLGGNEFVGPPFGVPSSAAQFQNQWFLGSDRGVFQYAPSGWMEVPDPGQQPITRVHGLSSIQQRYLIGGLGGTFLGVPGNWRRLSSESLQSSTRDQNGVWFLLGSGSVNKIDLKTLDVTVSGLHGAVKRPQATALGSTGATTLFGLYGGWAEKDGKQTREKYPPELKGEFVTAIAGDTGTRWIGTQVSGLWRFNQGTQQNWNPASGLEDPWVTSIIVDKVQVWVGTYGSGLYTVAKGKLKSHDCPTQKVRRMALWGGNLVVGGLDGAWVQIKGQWRTFDTKGMETTGISVVGQSVWIMTPLGSLRFSPPK